MQLLTLRTKACWSQEFVARQMAVSRATIVNWERGTTEPSISDGVQLAKLFGITVAEFRSDDPY